MQEHSIPQDITGYRFHIIGSMTLKQFGEVFLGVVVAIVIYNTNLIAPIKWLFIILSVGIGAMAAFVPIGERPLDHWITTFIRIMYRPTKYFWKKEAAIPEVFKFETLKSTIVQDPELDLTPAKRQRIKEYLGSVPEQSSTSTDFSQNEISRMRNILSSFDTVDAGPTQVISPTKYAKNKPNLDIRVRSMRMPKEETVVFDTSETVDVGSEQIQASGNQASNITKISDPKKITLSSDQVAQDIQIPKKETIVLKTKVEKSEENNLEKNGPSLNEKSFIKDQDLAAKDIGATKDANFNSDLPFPIKPTEPNKLVGMILSKNNDLLTGSIVEVQRLDGHIERAVKTNALGQFFITTPLKVGEYNIIIEKDNYTFQPLHIKVDNTIIQPMEIRSEN